jgi:hypothetical protein
MKKLFLIALAVMLLIRCDEPLEPVEAKNLRISAWQHGADFHFAGLPIFFAVQENRHPFNSINIDVDRWNFGDVESTEATVYHTFHFPGDYKISVTTDNGKGYKDTTLHIMPRLSLIGSKSKSENGKFIFKHPTSGYTTIHTENSGSSVDLWCFLTTTTGFDSIRTTKYDWGYSTPHLVFMNKNNNIVMARESYLTEYDHSGRMIRQTFQPSSWFPTTWIETANGYQFAGYFYTGMLRVAKFNNSLELVEEIHIDLQRDGYYANTYYLESEDVLRVHYAMNTGQANPPRLLVRRTVSGTVQFEKSYSGDLAPSMSYKLSTGYLLAGVQSHESAGTQNFLFHRVNENGDILWTLESPVESVYPQYIHGPKMKVLEKDNAIYIFFDNQKGMKINSDGQVIWLKRFGINADTFNDALINDSGNFVLLGSHQFDYLEQNYTNEYAKRDLSLMEIDKDGNIVQH